jgi:hypothetical protein
VIRVVGHPEVPPDQVDDPSARPHAGAIAGRLRPRHDEARQATALRGAELRGTPRGGAGPEPGAPALPVRPLPPADGAPIDAEAHGHDMNRSVALQEFDRGTAWLFAHADLDGAGGGGPLIDTLVIDEAGQVALADALAMGTAARNVILLGDPLQLAQVSPRGH